jgi:hypothetical protein
MGLDRVEFAHTLGIEVAVIAGLEDGTATADDVARWTSGVAAGRAAGRRAALEFGA